MRKTRNSKNISSPPGKPGRKTRAPPDTPGGAESVNSVTRKVPDWLKKQFADDLEEKAGIKNFGKGKPYTLSTDIFQESDTYEGQEITCLNLFDYWSRYSDKDYKKKVLDRWHFKTHAERERLKSENKAQGRRKSKSAPKKSLSFDWSEESRSSVIEEEEEEQEVPPSITVTKPETKQRASRTASKKAAAPSKKPVSSASTTTTSSSTTGTTASTTMSDFEANSPYEVLSNGTILGKSCEEVFR